MEERPTNGTSEQPKNYSCYLSSLSQSNTIFYMYILYTIIGSFLLFSCIIIIEKIHINNHSLNIIYNYVQPYNIRRETKSKTFNQ